MSSDQERLNLATATHTPAECLASERSNGTRAQLESAFLILDMQGRILFCSPDAPHLLGVQDMTLTGHSVAELIPALPLKETTSGYNLAYIGFWSRNEHWQMFKTNAASVEIRFNRLELVDQPYVTLEIRSPMLNPPKHALQKLIQAMEMSSEVVAITNPEGEIAYVNRTFEKLTGYRRDETLGRTHDLLGMDHSPELYANMWATLRSGKPFRGTFINRQKNGQVFHEERSVRPFIDEHGQTTHYIFTGRDVTDRERIFKRLEHLANHDVLTGLPNRNLFMDRLRQATVQALRRNSGFSLLLLDLDHFKSVNDKLGHAAGDALLIAVANRLKSCVREEDTVARLGGDEFAIILAETALPDDVLTVLEKIGNTLHQPLMLEAHEIPTNASIGAVFYPEDSMNVDTLLKFADIAMYRAKKNGGNGFHFHRQRGLSKHSATAPRHNFAV